MCGICGEAGKNYGNAVERSRIERINDALTLRGPGDEGYHAHEMIGLGQRRLSIIDLATGHLPIANENQTVWVVLNGEIYNFQSLREELLEKGHRISPHTDSEVIVRIKKIAGGYLPKKFVKLPKQDFGLPINTWLRGELKGLTDGLFNRGNIQALLDGTPRSRSTTARGSGIWSTSRSGIGSTSATAVRRPPRKTSSICFRPGNTGSWPGDNSSRSPVNWYFADSPIMCSA